MQVIIIRSHKRRYTHQVNVEMSINDSLQESPNIAAAAAGNSPHRFYPSVILPQMQIERLKREEEDDHWISGEELYTEGSSDDEDQAGDQKLIIKSDSHPAAAAAEQEIGYNAENICSINFMIDDNNHLQQSRANASAGLAAGPILCNRNPKLNDNIENPAVIAVHPRSFDVLQENIINNRDRDVVDEIEKVKIDESAAADSSYSCRSSKDHNILSLKDHEKNLLASNISEQNYAAVNNTKTLRTTTAAAVMQNPAMDINHKIAINAENLLEENNSSIVDEKMEKKISWRPKRGSILLPKLDKSESIDSIMELRELQFEYHEILESLSDLKTSLNSGPLNCSCSSTISSCSNNDSRINRCNNNDNNYYELKNEIENENDDQKCRVAADDHLFSMNPNSGSKILMLQYNLQLQNYNDVIKKDHLPAAASGAIIKDEEIIIEDDHVYNYSFNDHHCPDVNSWSNTIINTNKIKKEMFKMMELDTCIEVLDQKVKKVREETLNEQISNRKELKRLQTVQGAPAESGKLAKNSKQFYKLCSMEIESLEGEEITSAYRVPPIILPSENELEILESDEEEDSTSEKDEKKLRESRREKLEERLKIIDKRKASFIKKNKKLASYAMYGNLANLTDEEKNRLEKLLEDINNEELDIKTLNSEENSYTPDTINCSSSNYTANVSSTPYKIDEEADELLKNLTEQLANINSETYRKSEEEGSNYRTREELILPDKEQIILNSLKNLEESNSKEIFPISEEEMKELINEYYAEQEESSSSRINTSENNFRTKFSKNGIISNNSNLEIVEDDSVNSSSIINNESQTISKELINELVKEAKTEMPLFQFKYQTDLSIEEFEDDDEN